jgi:hypothetical protein
MMPPSTAAMSMARLSRPSCTPVSMLAGPPWLTPGVTASSSVGESVESVGQRAGAGVEGIWGVKSGACEGRELDRRGWHPPRRHDRVHTARRPRWETHVCVCVFES